MLNIFDIVSLVNPKARVVVTAVDSNGNSIDIVVKPKVTAHKLLHKPWRSFEQCPGLPPYWLDTEVRAFCVRSNGDLMLTVDLSGTRVPSRGYVPVVDLLSLLSFRTSVRLMSFGTQVLYEGSVEGCIGLDLWRFTVTSMRFVEGWVLRIDVC